MNVDMSMTGIRARLAPIATLYLAGMLQGLTLVSFPASSAVLKQLHGFTDAQYGAIFLPQVAAAIVGALAGGSLANRLGLKPLLWLSLAINALSQGLLAGSLMLSPGAAYAAVLSGTASLGLAFGLSGAPLNGYPPLFFPSRRDTAIVALHTFLGLGLAIGPVIASPFVMAGHWIGFPLSLVALAGLLVVATGFSRFPPLAPDAASGTGDWQSHDPMPLPQSMTNHRAGHPVRVLSFWLFTAVAVLYAFAEGTFSNWAVLYLLTVKHLPETVAAGALSVFWAAMVAGRLLTSVLVLRIPPRRIWLGLPLLMILAFLSLPYADTPVVGIGLFALAGLACSAFFPLSIGIVSERFRAHGPWVASMMIAALMAGVGVGSYTVGLLREAFAMETVYRLSIVYPLLALGLAVLALRERDVVTGAEPRSRPQRLPDPDEA